MRLIGHLDSDRDARVFGDFLYVQGIENEAERDDGRWAVWVHSDDQISAAKKLLDEFRATPNDARFLAGSPAEKLRKKAQAEEAVYRKRLIDGRTVLPGLQSHGFGFVTYALIVGSVIVFFLSQMGDNLDRVSGLLITGVNITGNSVEWERGLREIRHGQVWRLASPILIHFGFMHLLFNMMWLRDLGSLFEARLRSGYLLAFVLVIAAASNFGQYAVTGKPLFGGMSGVVYGLIGYVWVRGRLDPAAGMSLDKQSVVFAMIWFGLCFTGWLGPIANTAHAVGLVGGALWAFIDSKRR